MPKLTKDVTLWMTDELHKGLTEVIMAKENFPRIYYILVKLNDGYEGPSIASVSQRTIDLSGKHVNHNRIIILEEWQIPPVSLISTVMLRINNRIGEVDWQYVLPPDNPIESGTKMGKSCKFIWKSAQGMPLVYSSN